MSTDITFQRHIDRDSGKKLYIQLAEIIREEVDKGQIEVGAQLPSEDALCTQFNISKAVVRQALSELADAGYLRKVQGRGTYIEKPAAQAGVPMVLGLDEYSIDFGEPTTTRVVEKKVTVPPSEVRRLFGDEEIRTTKVVRVVSVRREVVLLDTLYVPEAVCPGLGLLDLREQSFHTIFEKRYRRTIRRVAQSCDHTVAESHEAELLGCEPGDTLLLMDRIVYADSEVPVAFSRSLCRTEKGRLTLMFHRR